MDEQLALIKRGNSTAKRHDSLPGFDFDRTSPRKLLRKEIPDALPQFPIRSINP
jgi:hypothetical protein